MEACLSGFHTNQFACELSLGLLSYYLSGRWTGLGTLNFATTFLSNQYDYRHKWYSI